MTRTVAVAIAIMAAGPLHAQGTGGARGATASPGLTPAPGNASLSVASVKMDDGVRASKFIGASVFGESNTQLGTVDDLILTPDHRVAFAIVAVGGLMGVGAKLVAIPIGQLQPEADGRMMLPDATKDSLTAMPTFVYNG